jgi:O-antigen ligase
VISDVQWREEIGRDVRQRYLEWQALINLLKDRSAVGTGVGCLNDRRSEYYLRLPKNNTIAPFDQNGYLAAAAEMGVPGLIAWCWVLGEYLKKGWRRRNDMVIRAAWSGVAAATVAQVASSLTYNGILVVFVVLLALIDHEEGRSEDAPI